MVRKFKITLITSLLLSAVVGCTVAVPDVTSLSQILSFSSKSVSPFDQDNLGGSITFSGYCLPGVTGFEYRFNSFTLWSDIPSTAPSPGAGEYLVGSQVYDVDCSDGEFNFYIFQSSIMDNFDLNGVTTPTDGDPSSIELRAKGDLSLPSIIYTRPQPTSFYIINDQFDFYGNWEVERSLTFRIRMIDSSGREAMLPSGQSRLVTITATDIDGTSLPAGEIYNSTCSSPAVNADKTFVAGDDEIILCYMGTGGVTAEHTIRVQVSYPGMIPASFDIRMKPTNSVTTWLTAAYGSGMLPPVLLKGIDYGMAMGMSALYSNFNARYVTSFRGNLRINSSSSGVQFIRIPGDTDCPSTYQNSVMICTANTTQKNIYMNVDPAYTGESVNLTVTALPEAGCGANCTLYGEGNSYQINNNDYLSRTITIPVTDGPSTYAQPYFRLSDYNQTIRLDECMRADIGHANINDVALPSLVSRNFSITTTGAVAQFYYSWDCTGTSAGTSFNTLLSTGELFRQVYFRANSNYSPSDGRLEIQITDMNTTTTYSKFFYIKADD